MRQLAVPLAFVTDQRPLCWNAVSWFALHWNDKTGPFAIVIQRDSWVVYINATSTRECTFRAVFAAECSQMSTDAGWKKL